MSHPKVLAARPRSRLRLPLLLAGAGSLLGVSLARTSVGRDLGAELEAAAFRLRPPSRERARRLERLLVVAIDDPSVAAEGLGDFRRWPRTHLAEAVEYLDAAGAAAIGLDVLLSEPDPLFPQDDEALRRAMASSGRVVLAATARRREVSGGDPIERIEPTPAFAAASAARGLVNLHPEEGRRRTAGRYPFGGFAEASELPAFAAALVRVAGEEDPGWGRGVLDAVDPAREGRIEERSFLGLLEDARVWRDLRRAHRRGEVGEAAVTAALAPDLRGRIVVLGPTATGLGDFYRTPFGTEAGPTLHGLATAQLLAGLRLREVPDGGPLFLLAFAWALGAAAWVLRSEGVPRWCGVVGAVVGPLALAVASLATADLLLAPLAIAVAGFVSAVGGALVSLAELKRSREALRETFGRFVSPAVVDRLANDPARARPGGERRTLTVLQSDIRGFTSLCEGRDPEEVTAFLNRYFEEMVEVLWEHGATVDKFMGDGIMAFFNAPLDQPDHAARGVRAAIAMAGRARSLAARLAAEGALGAGFRIGVALHSGPCLVGNIGASRAMGYTAIGDVVNTSARLEGLNSKLGTTILVGATTYELAHPSLGRGLFRRRAAQAVKGREAPVAIHEVPVEDEEARKAA